MDSSNSGGRAHHQMTKKYGVGILGAGWVAGEYVKAFRDHPLTEIRGIYSHTPGKAGRLLKQQGVEGREYSSEYGLFNHGCGTIDACCTPTAVRTDQRER